VCLATLSCNLEASTYLQAPVVWGGPSSSTWTHFVWDATHVMAQAASFAHDTDETVSVLLPALRLCSSVSVWVLRTTFDEPPHGHHWADPHQTWNGSGRRARQQGWLYQGALAGGQSEAEGGPVPSKRNTVCSNRMPTLH
jgi:hypothetical protein